jgi:hypothetical protein
MDGPDRSIDALLAGAGSGSVGFTLTILSGVRPSDQPYIDQDLAGHNDFIPQGLILLLSSFDLYYNN